MPYRRLPNTDSARFRAVKTALEKGKDLPPFKLPYSQQSLLKLKAMFPEYERAFLQLKECNKAQLENSKKYLSFQYKAKIYISHFIQVLNFAIMRGELPENAREFYEIDIKDKKVPRISSEKDLIKWGERVIKGEPERIANGGNPVTNPTIAVVKVHFDHFITAYRHNNTLKEHYKRASEKVASMRKEADEIIVNIWNEVEAFFSDLKDEEKREKAKEYGLVYFYRKSELGIGDKKKISDKKISEINDEQEQGDSVNDNDLQYSLLLFKE